MIPSSPVVQRVGLHYYIIITYQTSCIGNVAGGPDGQPWEEGKQVGLTVGLAALAQTRQGTANLPVTSNGQVAVSNQR